VTLNIVMGFQEPPIYVLLWEGTGWKSSDKFVSQQQQSLQIQRGSILQVDNFHCFDPGKSVSVTLSVLGQPSVKITSLLRHLASVSRPEMQLLRSVSSLETRCRLVVDRCLGVSQGDSVSYLPPQETNSPVRAIIRYIGPVPELGLEGHQLGLEITEPGWARGSGSAPYFTCPPGRAVFSTIADVLTMGGSEDNSFQQTNGSLANMMNNLPLSSSRNNRNVNMVPANNLRRIHNELRNKKNTESDSELAKGVPPLIKSQELPPTFPRQTPSPTPEVQIIRPKLVKNPRGRKDSDHFSWDPNSRRSTSRASVGRENGGGGGGAVRRQESPASRLSPGSSTSSCVLSPGHQPEQKTSPSSNLDQGYFGRESDSDTPPPPPPLTWSQRLASGVAEQDRASDHLSPARPESPHEFVQPCSEQDLDLQVIAVGSMVQLETQHGEELCGVVRYCGDSPARPGRWVGVEMEEEIRGGTNGWVQNCQMFSCAPGKGVFVPYSHVIPDPRFKETLPVPSIGQDFGPLDSPVVPGFCAPHPTVESVAAICGRNKGIQGHQNSCYLDATLFSMFTFSSVFDSLLYRPRSQADIPRYEEVQTLLKDEIVNPLRKNLFVRADKVMKLRTMLDNLSDVKGLMDQEKDPEEFLSSILTQVMNVEPFLELSSGQTAHHYQLIVDKDPNIVVPSVQDLFDQSFATGSCRVKLKRAPSVLILQMPRFGRQFKLYERILPSGLLDVTDVIVSSPRQCVICGVLAEWECPECYGSHEQGLASTAYCSLCLQRTHEHKRRGHKQERLEKPAGWTKQTAQPIPRIYMELFAVVCIETSHYVSFVRCGDSPRAPWCFFDSMADRKGEQNGYNIPELSPATEIENIMTEAWAEQLRSDPARPLGDQAKRLVSDAYMCFYQSPDVKMYR